MPRNGVRAQGYQSVALAVPVLRHLMQHQLGHRPCQGDVPGDVKETDKQEVSKHMGLTSSLHPTADI